MLCFFLPRRYSTIPSLTVWETASFSISDSSVSETTPSEGFTPYKYFSFLAPSSSNSEESEDDVRKKAVRRPVQKRRLNMTKEQRDAEDDYHKQRFRQTFSRLLKSDFRKELGVGFCNAINSLDGSFISSFLKQHCTRDCRVNDTIEDALFGRGPICAEGVDLGAQLLCRQYEDYPDMVATLLGSRIVRKYREEGSCVFVYYRLDATKLIGPVSGVMLRKGITLLCCTTFVLNEECHIVEIRCEANVTPTL